MVLFFLLSTLNSVGQCLTRSDGLNFLEKSLENPRIKKFVRLYENRTVKIVCSEYFEKEQDVAIGSLNVGFVEKGVWEKEIQLNLIEMECLDKDSVKRFKFLIFIPYENASISGHAKSENKTWSISVDRVIIF